MLLASPAATLSWRTCSTWAPSSTFWRTSAQIECSSWKSPRKSPWKSPWKSPRKSKHYSLCTEPHKHNCKVVKVPGISNC
ncbi:hypothetical protein FKM82_019877 [Ascaphus truei]